MQSPSSVPPSASTVTRRQIVSGVLGLGAAATLLPTRTSGQEPAPRGPAPSVTDVGYGTAALGEPLKSMPVPRRGLQPNDVDIGIDCCGVCHSDVHQVRNDWKNTIYPCVPGHEIVGRVTAVGTGVSRFAVGDVVAVGPLVDSCRSCPGCTAHLEQYCEGPRGATFTYNGPMRADGTNTFGGYSGRIVVTEDFVLKVPDKLGKDLPAVAPLLCAGITTYSPLKHWKAAGKKVGVVGMGGLGHMGVKLAKAMDAVVTVFSTSPDKQEDARAFGAAEFVLSRDAAAMREHEARYDLLLDTVPVNHDVTPLLRLLKRDGTMVVVGMLVPFLLEQSEIAFHRRALCGSLCGGIAETQEMLEFCAGHGITATVQTVPITSVNDTLAQVQSNKARYRYVIDVAGSLAGTQPRPPR